MPASIPSCLAVAVPVAGFLLAAAGGALYALGRLSLRRAGGRAAVRALEVLGAGFVVFDGRGRVSSSNAAIGVLLGLEPDITHALRDIFALRDIPELSALLVAGEGRVEYALGDGMARRRIEAMAFPLVTGKGTALILRDITENTLLVEKLTALASRDALTGVFNRRRFDELGERDIDLSRRSGRSVGVLMLDIDSFKRVNDERGHSAGDEVLKAICVAGKEALRSSDVLARYGGEEFAFLLPGSGVEESLAIAERLRGKIEGLQVPYEGGSVSVTASLGAYSGVPAPGEGLALYLRRADEALYMSKAMGRNRVSYWKPIDQGEQDDPNRAH